MIIQLTNLIIWQQSSSISRKQHYNFPNRSWMIFFSCPISSTRTLCIFFSSWISWTTSCSLSLWSVFNCSNSCFNWTTSIRSWLIRSRWTKLCSDDGLEIILIAAGSCLETSANKSAREGNENIQHILEVYKHMLSSPLAYSICCLSLYGPLLGWRNQLNWNVTKTIITELPI